jgi:DNA-binding beta-propeller fold protein YncE
MLKEGEFRMLRIAKTLAFVVSTSLILTGVSLAESAPLYKQVAKYTIGGDGGWDYITYDPSGNRLFVAHNSAIYVIDATSGKKTGEIPANGAHGVALVPDKGLGFSSNGRAGTVTVFDLKTLTPKSDIKVGENPDAIIYDKYANRVIVMNGRSHDLMAIDPDSLKVVATVPLGGKLEFAAADPGHVYVNVEDTGEIAVVDSTTWKATERWKLTDCEEPSGLAIDEAAGHLFTVCGNSKMLVVDKKTGKAVATPATGKGTDAAAFDPKLGYAFASNGEGTLTVVRRVKGGTYDVAANIPTQRGARTMAVDPSSHRIFLPTAELGPPAEGQTRPSIKPGSFEILVYAPSE